MTIGGNINITAAASVILFGLCLYMILTKNKIIRIIYIPAAVIQFMTVILTGSRTSFLALTFVSLGTAILLTWDVLRDKGTRLRIAGTVLAAVICVAAILAAQVVTAVLNKKASELDDDDDDKGAEAPEAAN